MPYKLEITAESPAEMAELLSGLFAMPVLLSNRANAPAVAVARAGDPVVVAPDGGKSTSTRVVPAAEAEPAEKPKRRGRPPKAKPETSAVNENGEDAAIEPAETTDETAIDDDEPPTFDELKTAVLAFITAIRESDADNDTAGQDALAKVFNDVPNLSLEGADRKISNIPEDRRAEVIELVNARKAELS